MPSLNTQNLSFDQLQQNLTGSTDHQIRSDQAGQVRTKDHSEGFFGRLLGRNDKFDRAAQEVQDALQRATGQPISPELQRQIRAGVAGKTGLPVDQMLGQIRDSWHQEATQKHTSPAALDTHFSRVASLALRPEGKQMVANEVHAAIAEQISNAKAQGITLSDTQIKDATRQAFDSAALKVSLLAKSVTDVKELQAGQHGEVFKVTYGDGASTVVKLQNENPAANVVAAQILAEAKVNAPAIAAYDNLARNSLADQADSISHINPAAQKLADGLRADTRPHVVEMDFAKGESLKDRLASPGAAAMLTQPEFQEQLGKILAADAFMANPDRAFAVEKRGKLEGWYNEGNLIIDGTGPDLVVTAIDNELVAGLNTTSSKLFGMKTDDWQHSSLAAMKPEEFKKEVAAVLDRMIQEGNKAAVAQGRPPITLSDAQKADFVNTVNQSAQASLDKLLEHGQDRKQKLQDAGVAQDTIDGFADHKRAMRLLRGEGDNKDVDKPHISVKEALTLAKDRAAYRQHMGKDVSSSGGSQHL